VVGNAPPQRDVAQATNTASRPGAVSSWLRRLQGLVLPILALLTALIFCGLLLLLTQHNPFVVYDALWTGAVTGQASFANTLVVTTPYVLLGLALAIGFKASLFNIGAEGQYIVGAIGAIWAGHLAAGLPAVLLGPWVLLMSAVFGGLYASVAGVLKVLSGAHEVITTIMLNYVAAYAVSWLVDDGGALHDGTSQIQQSYYLPKDAWLPIIWPSTPLHAGILIALVIATLAYVLIWRTTWGFELRASGFNPLAARSAGVSIKRVTLWAMALSGALSGLAGGIQIAGLQHVLPDPFGSGFGFDAIAVAIIGGGTPAGIVLAAMLLGALHNGSTYMEMNAGISGPFVSVIEATVLFFVAAPVIIRWLYFGWYKRRTGRIAA
jgi:ABC-type uncharacterized transport system permease subunit